MKKFEIAFLGLIDAIKDKSVSIQLCLGGVAICAGLILRFSLIEMVAILLCIGMVVTAEILNTCIELVCNRINKEFDEDIKRIKDMAAGAVLFVSLVALVVAAVIFFGHVWRYFG